MGIHEHNITKRLKSFALCYSQLLLLADFFPLYGFLRLEFSTATAEGGGGGFGILFVYQTSILTVTYIGQKNIIEKLRNLEFSISGKRCYFLSILRRPDPDKREQNQTDQCLSLTYVNSTPSSAPPLRLYSMRVLFVTHPHSPLIPPPPAYPTLRQLFILTNTQICYLFLCTENFVV